MKHGVMLTTPPSDTSPVTKARIVAALFLATIVAGIIAQAVISDRLVVFNDASATATNILANTMLYRLAFTIYMIEMACQMAMAVLFYEILEPVNRSVARIALVLGLTGTGIKTLARLFYYAPLILLSGAQYLSPFDASEVQALSLAFLRINGQGAGIALIFIGFQTALDGWLVFKSTFLPKFLGVLSMIAGLGWITFIWPPLGHQLFMFVALIALLGSVAMIGWLFVRGVDEQRWREQATLAAASIWR